MLSIRSRRPIAFIVCSVVAVAAVVAWWFIAHRPDAQSPSPAAQTRTISSPFGLKVDADSSLAVSQQATKLEQSGTLWQLDSPATTSTFRISADYEQGDTIKKLVAASKKSPRDAMADNLNRQLPQAYPGYKLIDKKQLSQHGSDGLMMEFTYSSNDQTVRQHLLLLVKSDSAAAYIRAQALDAEFGALDSRYFAPLFSSARFE